MQNCLQPACEVKGGGGGGGGGADTMSLNFCENNIAFYTGTLKICKKRCGTSYRFDAIDQYISIAYLLQARNI